MSNSYGILEDQLVKLFRSAPPNFAAAELLLEQGVDLNSVGSDDDENMLSKIIMGYGFEHAPDYTESSKSMCEVIRFFLNHGFDLQKHDGCYGAQCLYALGLSTYDRYIIDATKILLDAGAQNCSISLTSDDEIPSDYIGTKGGYLGICDRDYALANIYEAVYQIYEAIADNRPYSGIDSYEVVVGKKIEKVLAEANDGLPIFYKKDLPEFQKDNCFNKTLFFVYEGGVLVSTQYSEFWTDTVLPSGELVDVSEHFAGVVGSTVESFEYDYKEVVRASREYGQPIITIGMDSGRKARFTINFGEVKEAERCAYLEII